jgi:FlaA1/EpsC-like NDP-sugar epimerase
MGTPVKIIDLARSLIRLAGKSEKQVAIQFTGLRPGEKLSEDLFYPTEEILATSHPKIKRARGCWIEWPELLQNLEDLRDSVVGSDAEICAKIKAIIPEYSGRDGQETRLSPTRALKEEISS